MSIYTYFRSYRELYVLKPQNIAMKIENIHEKSLLRA